MNTKRCTHCKQYKPLDQFNKNRAMKDGYQNQCRECHRASIKKWDDNNKQHRKEHDHQWYLDNKEKINARNNARCRERWNNDPAYRARKNEQKLSLYYSNPDFRKRHLERASSHSRKRRALKLGSNTSFTEQQWIDLCNKYGNRCLCCGKKAKLTRDHVVPLTRGGSNDISNIQPLCMKCNHKKLTKIIDYRR